MSIAVREGGPNPANNSRLRDLIAKAKSNNVPNENIERVIKKASGNDGVVYEEITYEGYGPRGVAVIVETATDNKNRTAGDVRHFFDKYGGKLGMTGCVGYLFTEKGIIVIDNEDGDIEEDKLMEDALEAGAADFAADGDIFEITTEPSDVFAVSEALQAKGYTIASADKDKIPANYVELTDEEDIKNMELMLEHLEDCDDVQNVYHNWDIKD
jgi:YebC/PmpR family DNA-binding regulatory protein